MVQRDAASSHSSSVTEVEKSAYAARPDAVGYLLVRAFRERALEQVFAPLAALVEAQGLKARDLKLVPETPGWALIQAARPDTLPETYKTWPELLQRAGRGGEPVLARHGLQLQHVLQVLANPGGFVGNGCEFGSLCLIGENGFGR